MAVGDVMAESFDVAIIGSGPGGYVAAIRAAQLKLRTVVIEKAELGGICANWGCIPTKALLHTAEVYAAAKAGGELGISANGLKIDFPQVIRRSRKVASMQNQGVGILFKKNKITHIAETATLAKAKDGGIQIQVKNQPIVAKNIILATGARPKIIPGLEPDRDRIITYFEAMNLPAQPKSLIVVGAGAIGVEFAYFYNALGTQVTLIEAMPRILPGEDTEISDLLAKNLKKQGIQIFTDAKVTKLNKTSQQVEVQFKDASGDARTLKAERLLSAVGVTGNVENLGLEACGIQTDRGFIKVDEWYRTLDASGKPISSVYAIGDVIGPPMLAHKASAEGIACVEFIAGIPQREIRRVNYSAIPGATFCRPEVGSMGLTEAQAKEKGYTIKVGKFPFKVSGKAQATGETEGLVKTVVDAKTGEILGTHILGGTASDMVATMTLARSAELTSTEILHTVFAHPTYAEIMKGSIEAAYGEAIDL